MALRLNVFRTITAVVSTTPGEIYISPVGYTGVVLLAQVTNISTTTSYDITLLHRRGGIDTELFKTFPVPFQDTINLLTGKLVLESGDKLVLSGSNASNLKFIASVLETLN
jgi:hypothetical protein